MTGRRAWLRWAWDAGERIAATFAEGFLSVVTLDALVGGRDLLTLRQQLGAGALAGAYALVKALAARQVGRADSASVVPVQAPPLRAKRRKG